MAEELKYVEYVVKENDTLATISEVNKVTIELLTTHNNISDEIKPGQILKIPKLKSKDIVIKCEEPSNKFEDASKLSDVADLASSIESLIM